MPRFILRLNFYSAWCASNSRSINCRFGGKKLRMLRGWLIRDPAVCQNRFLYTEFFSKGRATCGLCFEYIHRSSSGLSRGGVQRFRREARAPCSRNIAKPMTLRGRLECSRLPVHLGWGIRRRIYKINSNFDFGDGTSDPRTFTVWIGLGHHIFRLHEQRNRQRNIF